MSNSQVYALKKARENKIKELCKGIENHKSGIYLFFRWNIEKKKWCCYVGQATKSILERCASHLIGYKTKNPSHIDLSLKSHGIFSENNSEGWMLKVLTDCEAEDCNYFEQRYISKFRNNDRYIVYNITIGSQGKGKVDFQKRKLEKLKRYKNGKNKGKTDILMQIKNYFEKYLDFAIKEPTNKIKQRKFNEFKELLEGTDDTK